MTRRHALLFAAPALNAQRLTPVEELVNTFEMEQMAQRKLPADLFKEIAGSNRAAFDRMSEACRAARSGRTWQVAAAEFEELAG